MLFYYRAITEEGSEKESIIDADSMEEAKEILIQRSIIFTSIAPIIEKKKGIFLKKRELASFTRQLAKLLKAGLPLYESLLTLEEKYRDQSWHRLLLDLCDQVKTGRSLSEAMALHPRAFDFLYRAMIENAEKSGNLENTLEEITILLSKQEGIKKQIINALLYPSILFGFSLCILCVLFFYIVPSLFELFEGRSLHPLTTFVFMTSQFLISNKTIMTLILFVLLGVSFFLYFSKKKMMIWSLLMRVSWIGSLMIQLGLVRFCRSFSALLRSGLSYLDAMSLSRQITKHPLLEKRIAMAESKVREGKLLSDSWKEDFLIPKMVVRLIAVGEKSADFPSMLLHIAEIYEEEVEKKLAHFSTMLQPILLLIMGVIIGFVVLSVLIPLTDVGSFMEG